jgi:hypothetical protein
MNEQETWGVLDEIAYYEAKMRVAMTIPNEMLRGTATHNTELTLALLHLAMERSLRGVPA